MRKTFTVQELIKSNLAKKLGIENKPNTDQEKNLEDLIDICLDPIRIFFPGAITVYSGFRSEKLNRALNKSNNSLHLLGLECDIRPTSRREEDFQRIMNLAKQLNFDTLILKRKWTGVRWLSYISISYNPQQCMRYVIENYIVNPDKVPKLHMNDFKTKSYVLPPF